MTDEEDIKINSITQNESNPPPQPELDASLFDICPAAKEEDKE
jgi:hypothetical protein